MARREQSGGTAQGLALAFAAAQALTFAPTFALTFALVGPALAQPSARPAARPPAPTPAPRPAPSPAPRPAPSAASADGGGEDDVTEVDELVDTATSPQVYASQPGAALGGLAPELEIGPLDIQAYGVSTVTELLDELAIQTNSSRGRGGESPVVLLNGKRISGLAEVRDIPTEAIRRVDILPEETALSYGFTADQKVVNIVLRPRFRALTGEGSVQAPTAGGQAAGTLNGDQFRVRGDNRLNIDVKLSAASELTYAARGLTGQANGPPYALLGNIASAIPRAQIDPALTALAGRPVFAAGVPAAAASRALALADFVPTAGALNSDDLGKVRDLSPANRSLTANLVAARAWGDEWSSTVNATFTASPSRSLQGLPRLALTVPPGPASPFSQPVRLYRYLDGLGPLKQDTDTWSGHVGVTVNKQAGPWRFSLTGAYDHTDTLIETGMGVDAAPLNALLASGSAGFDPFGPIPASLLAPLPNSEARSISDSGELQVLVNGPLVKLPSGNLNLAVKFGDSQSGFVSASQRWDLIQDLSVVQAASLSRNDLGGQLNLDLPLASRRYDFLPWFGELAVNANASFDRLSDFGVIHSLGYGLNWTPIPQVRLIVSHTRDEAAPSVSQLGSPTVITPDVRVFDYVAGQTLDVTSITGPNPALVGDTRNVFKAGVTIRPWTERRFSLNANYVDQRIDNPISTFPSATAQVQAAFPDRFLRDAAGDLIQQDLRPVNFAWTRRRDLRFGFYWSTPVGKAPPRPQRPEPPAARRDGRGSALRGLRGFGRGGGGRGGSGQGRFTLAVFDTVYFTDQTLLRPGGPRLDLLAGAPSGKTGGQPINAVDGQMGFSKDGLGARLNATWVEGTTVQGGGLSPSGVLSFSDLTTIHLRLFANLGQVPGLARRHPFLRGARLTVAVFNLFDQRLKVRDAAGFTPLGYQPALLDPAGRQVAVSFRKLF
jgi:hypothetical protein